jgi:hypothetical protein
LTISLSLSDVGRREIADGVLNLLSDLVDGFMAHLGNIAANDGHDDVVDFVAMRGGQKGGFCGESSTVPVKGLCHTKPIEHWLVVCQIHNGPEKLKDAAGSAICGLEDQGSNVRRDEAKVPGVGNDVVNAGCQIRTICLGQCSAGSSGNFYNELDGQLELSLEVLDDFTGEAVEVTTANPWLNYALPLHRLREFGFHDRVFDMLDERSLTKSEIRDFCALLFGKENFDGVVDPSLDWDSFAQDMARLLSMESNQYDPVNKRVAPWMSIHKMNRIHGSSACVPDTCAIM